MANTSVLQTEDEGSIPSIHTKNGWLVKWDNTSFASLSWEFDSLIIHQHGEVNLMAKMLNCEFRYGEFNSPTSHQNAGIV